ncbi:MAG TPA: STN domain-containing protein [Luteibacter sp.]|uniref:STN domain-containing protein n=1 Tax=Luteibacter sp. TaxID=1886636 RepID=UPI002C0C6BD9|nr:STN domain-containing protein [Luteibacter sp.]HVI53696.1 STN domain-containing protein [Luteibacter sp.]
MTRCVFALVACSILFASPPLAAQTRTPAEASQGSEETHAPTRFDIDAQPLATALRGYSEATGIAVLFDGALVEGRSSPGIHGVVDARDALRVLLVGTGLSAHFSSMNAFTVTADPATVTEANRVAKADSSDDAPSLGSRDAAMIQAAIEAALCAHVATRPGSFRLAMQVWIDATGAIDDVAALAPSDDPQRDTQVLAALRGVRVAPSMSRFSPVTVLLTPSAPGTYRCAGARAWQS